MEHGDCSQLTKRHPTTAQSLDTIRKSLEEHQKELTAAKNKSKTIPKEITNVVKVKLKSSVPLQNVNEKPKMISVKQLQEWAKEISDKLVDHESMIVRRDLLVKGFKGLRSERRNGTEIVEQVAASLRDLLSRRAKAAEAIMRKAEELSKKKTSPPPNYTYTLSNDLNQWKKEDTEWKEDRRNFTFPLNCRSLNKVKLHQSSHFDAEVSLDTSSVHVAIEVFDCDPLLLEHLHWSEGLISTFKENYAQDATLDFQYMCSAKGFLRHYPAALWDSMYKLKLSVADIYDCRLRPWYVSASGAPRDILILLDASGSMKNSSNLVIAEQLTLALLSALTDDDQVNVLRFNVTVRSPITCFNNKLVPANHVNSAAIMAAMEHIKMWNETWMGDVLEYSVRLLQKHRGTPDRPPSCQQAIVLLTDSLYGNYTQLLNHLDPDGHIRLFVMWLHDQYGIRDDTKSYGEFLSCARDGYYAELITPSDVTEQVMRILRVLERPLVGQRKHRLTVYSDVYAHVEDPRRSEHYWKEKENAEQVYRYQELRKNKAKLLNQSQLYHDYMRQLSLDKYGYYYEGEDINYRLQISVSVPVFDHTTLENITIKLDEEKQRNSTRTYPVNRLLGVAGVDIPIDHLKLYIPYYQLGPGGSFMLLDHRGSIVLHDNMKPTFDGDILKPGYRTVDFLDVEQSASDHLPREYPKEWLEFRKELVLERTEGNKTMYSKYIYDEGMRGILQMHEYHWKRVLDHYTAVVVLPKGGGHRAVPNARHFTQTLAKEAYKTLSETDFSIHPDWMYCRHVEPQLETQKDEILYFLKRRKNEPNFQMQNLRHSFSPIPPTLQEKPYQCSEELMARIMEEAIATAQWSEIDEDQDCSTCQLGSVIAFFASESGFTRWQYYEATSPHAEPPPGWAWARGATEPWFVRASANAPALTIHAPVAPIRHLRNTDAPQPQISEHQRWLTAARVLYSTGKNMIGVAGFHFYPRHLDDLLKTVTNIHCPEEDESKCEPRCDNKEWSCVLIDDEGWVVAKVPEELDEEIETEPLRDHLANVHPAAMAALLNASVFKLRWIHDYQGVCFPPEHEKIRAAAPILPSILRSLWSSMKLFAYVTKEFAAGLFIISNTHWATAETEAEKQKRHRRVQKDFEREKYERLYDPRVLVNRTRFAACDRSRPVYQLQRTPKAMEALRRSAHACRWPLTAAPVPDTNLLLLAIYNACPYRGRPLNNPLVNEQVEMADGRAGLEPSASRLACWRNRVSLPGRPPHVQCFPHNYSYEEGYRQCGPWLPDPENRASYRHVSDINCGN
ncbi:voltage-dependent calcium channel subunit alpha-2/delta-4-like [Battus philenor]|uniref:voltage-dependent calcium channel subunit alpha-2/delta-4-like n=1 Tax=Battus philenor TaxID=42288 RepID=UPI0035D0710C